MPKNNDDSVKNPMTEGLLKFCLKIVSAFVVAIMVVFGIAFVDNQNRENIDEQVNEEVQFLAQSLQKYIGENSNVQDNDSLKFSQYEMDDGTSQISVVIGKNALENFTTFTTEVDGFTVAIKGKANNFTVRGYSEKGKKLTNYVNASIYHCEV